jgi:hypothetical protein
MTTACLLGTFRIADLKLRIASLKLVHVYDVFIRHIDDTSHIFNTRAEAGNPTSALIMPERSASVGSIPL